MKDIVRIIGFLCLIAVFGRLYGAEWVLFHPERTDMSYAVKPTLNGYFAVELPPGPCLVETFSGFSQTIDVPSSGFLFWEASPKQEFLNNAVRELQKVTGLRE